MRSWYGDKWLRGCQMSQDVLSCFILDVLCIKPAKPSKPTAPSSPCPSKQCHVITTLFWGVFQTARLVTGLGGFGNLITPLPANIYLHYKHFYIFPLKPPSVIGRVYLGLITHKSFGNLITRPPANIYLYYKPMHSYSFSPFFLYILCMQYA